MADKTLTQAEILKYKVVGVLCESTARESGSSLLPYDMPERDMPVAELSDEILALIGLTNLAIAQGGARC